MDTGRCWPAASDTSVHSRKPDPYLVPANRLVSSGPSHIRTVIPQVFTVHTWTADGDDENDGMLLVTVSTASRTVTINSMPQKRAVKTFAKRHRVVISSLQQLLGSLFHTVCKIFHIDQ